jgi:hypothetical protein
VLVLAVLVCAWFVVGIRQTHDINQASAIITAAGTPSAAASAHAGSLLTSAGWLNPDSEVDVLRGRLALLNNDAGQAEGIFAEVTRSEPMNLEAWVLLAQATLHGNHAVFEHAIGEISRLDPTIK